jgi:PKD domain-containing protein
MSISKRDLFPQRQACLFVVLLTAWSVTALVTASASYAEKPPTATFTMTPETPAPDDVVRFDASGSTAADKEPLIRYEWDLDGDGTYETDTGASPVASRPYLVEGTIAVSLRVTDNDDATGTATRPLTVALPTPVLGTSMRADPIAGQVRVSPPGVAPPAGAARAVAAAQQVLVEPAILPIGSTIDVTDGRVRLTFATAPADQAVRGPAQSAVVHGGEFVVSQGQTESLVVFRLAGDVAGCAEGVGARAAHAARAAAKSKPRKRRVRRTRPERRLWVEAEGSFRTEGRNAAAVVRGTEWLTEDACDGTLVRVARGTVQVRDHVRGRDVAVRQGEQYFARDACASRRNFRIHLFLPPGAKARAVEVRVAGRRIPVAYDGAYSALIDLRRLPRGRFLVHIRVLLADGARLTGTRSYHTCADRARKRYAPAL